MTVLLSPATSDYLLEPAPDHLHQDTTDWLSDLEFCRTELSFLHKLLDKTFLRIKNAERGKQLNALDEKVKTVLSRSLNKLHDDLIRHEQELSRLDEEVFSANRQSVLANHKKQETAVLEFLLGVKSLKKEIFAFVEFEMKKKI